MPIDISIDKERGLFIRTVRGAITTEEVIRSVEQVLAHPDFRPGMKSLSDLRDVIPYTSTTDVKAIAKLILSHSEQVSGVRAAVVVTQAISYGMMRMLQAYCDRSPAEIAVFYDLDEAMDWLDQEGR